MTPLPFDPRDAPHLDLLRRALEKIALQIDATDHHVFMTDLYVADAIALQLMVVGERARTWDIATVFAPALYDALPEPPPPEAFD